MRNALLIAKREFLERVRTRAFKISTVLIPLVMFGATYFNARNSDQSAHIVVVSTDNATAMELQAQLDKSDSDLQVDVRESSPNVRDRLSVAIVQKKIEAFVLIDTEKGSAQYVSGPNDHGARKQVDAAMQQVYARHHQQPPTLQTSTVQRKDGFKYSNTMPVRETRGTDRSGASDDAAKASYALFFLMYFVIMMHGINVASSIVEEKSSRVFEVMLATVTPQEMMAGKLFGVGAVGILQVALWMGFLAVIALTPLLNMAGAGGLSIAPTQIISFVVYFVLGFFLYSSLAAALGAMVSSEQELRQFNMLIALPMAVNTIVLYPVAVAPNSTFATVLSLIPTCTPLIMFLRISLTTVPMWQIALSLAIMAATIYCMTWFAARVYRIGILMYGKRPTFSEVRRWLRYS